MPLRYSILIWILIGSFSVIYAQSGQFEVFDNDQRQEKKKREIQYVFLSKSDISFALEKDNKFHSGYLLFNVITRQESQLYNQKENYVHVILDFSISNEQIKEYVNLISEEFFHPHELIEAPTYYYTLSVADESKFEHASEVQTKIKDIFDPDINVSDIHLGYTSKDITLLLQESFNIPLFNKVSTERCFQISVTENFDALDFELASIGLVLQEHQEELRILKFTLKESNFQRQFNFQITD